MIAALLSLIGFGASGITAGSIAAWIQSVWFGGAICGITGAIFSALQSIAAGGLGFAGKLALTGLLGATLNFF
ncbi:unnamed protein product [Larinioides sclopetarius]|uniref:Uncharacterized protein n=1 Tax=Larinioides sclopetarius TaxID=280406 RepID=A0AAV2AUY3_9ARAC